MSQLNQIRSDLDKGKSITAIDALNKYRCFRLAARINDLRNTGYPVDVIIVKSEGKRFAKYSRGRK